MRATQDDGKRIKPLTVLVAVLAVCLLLSLLIMVPRLFHEPGMWEQGSGVLLTNNSGQSRDGGALKGDYSAAFVFDLNKGGGHLDFVLKSGSLSSLSNATFRVDSMAYNDTELDVEIGSGSIIMVFVEIDLIWNGTYNHTYMAVHSPSSPSEDVGRISPTLFGLPESYYLQLVLWPLATAVE